LIPAGNKVRQGKLAELPFPALLTALAIERRTGTFKISRGRLSKLVVLEDGAPVDVRSKLAHETLGRFLVSRGRLDEQRFPQMLSESATRGIPLGEVLVDKGLLTPVELYRALQQNLASKLLDLFTWTEGDFRPVTDAPEPDSSLEVRVPQLVVTGVTKMSPQRHVDQAVRPLVGKPLALAPEPPFPLEEIRLSERQNRLVEALARAARTPLRMDELAAATDLADQELTRLLYALAVLGTIAPADQIPRKSPPPRPAQETRPTPHDESKPTAPPPPAAAPRAEELEAVEQRIVQRYLAYRRLDAFDLLSLPETAGLAEIRDSYLHEAKRFAPWTVAATGRRDLAGKANEIFLALAQAYGELTDTESRNTLIFRRKTLREQKERERHHTGQIQTDLLDSELQFEKGRQLMEAGKLREAVQQLQFASDCDPQSSLYRAELAWCRYLDSGGRGIADAQEELSEALRIDPRCGLALYYAGRVWADAGDQDRAEELLRRSIKPMAPDRRPIEALKDLKR
jgi:tetratricopeptide (TPR) repeat protein